MSFIVAQHIEMVARTFPERIAAEVIDGERVTYSELWRRVLRLATALRDVQAGPDGRMVAFLMSNGVEPLVASLACQWSGCASVPVNTRFAQAEILHVLRDSGATLLLSLGDQLERAHAAAAECGIRIAGELKYGRSGRVTLTDTTPKGRLNKGEDKPLHRGLLLRLATVSGILAGKKFVITAPQPDDFVTVVKRLSRGL